MVNTSGGTQAAPGRLEQVRELLNSWLVPNDTRVPEDRFDAYADQQGLQAPQRAVVWELRDDLRPAVEGTADVATVLNRWIERLEVRPRVDGGTVAFAHRSGLAGELVAASLRAVAAGQWQRLKACPDCRWVFYDRTRNASKRWCVMTAGGPAGRSCGSIAKVRAYRQRNRSRPRDEA